MEPHGLGASFHSRRAQLVGPAVAEQIVADVIELGWPVGQVLGSETELLDRYGISRAVLREAVRLVEHQRVGRMRRGPGGGLVIDEPDISTVINAVILHLLRVDATLADVVDTRLVLEEVVAESAAERATEADIAPIRQTLRDEVAEGWQHDRLLHAALASLTANPVLDLFVDILTRVADYFDVGPGALSPRLRAEVKKAHEQIAEAVLTNNPGLARVRMRRHLVAEAEFVEKHDGGFQRLPAAAALQGAAGDKRAEAVAREIFATILKAKQPPGSFIGSEALLMAEYSASRAVVREAVRILDHHHIAIMRRGPGGGLFVAAPDSSAVTDIIAIYLRRRGVGPNHVIEMLTGLELAVVERVSARLTSEDGAVSAPLRAYLETGSGGGPHPGLDWHSLLASLTGNSTLELLHRVVMRLGWLFFSRLAEVDPTVRQLSEPAAVDPVHQGITEALLAGDKELAMMRMRAHRAAPDA